MTEDWREEAGCRGVNTSVFYVHESDPNASELPAKAICWRCPVKDICLEYALLHEDHGIFGGLNAKERRRMAGLGRASGLPDPDRYEEVSATADVLVETGPDGVRIEVTDNGPGPASVSEKRQVTAPRSPESPVA